VVFRFSHTSTFELIPSVATALPGAMVTIGGEHGRFAHRNSLPVIGSAFLSRVSTLTRNIDIAILSVRPSVTFRYQMKTA